MRGSRRRSCKPAEAEAAAHTPSGASRHLPQQARDRAPCGDLRCVKAVADPSGAIGRAEDRVRPPPRSRQARGAGQRRNRRRLRWQFGRPRNVQRPRGGSRARASEWSAARLVCVREPKRRQRDRSPGPAIGRARSPGVPLRTLAQGRGPGRHRAAGSRYWPQAPELGKAGYRPVALRLHARRGADMVLKCRAPRCSRFAIQGLRPPSPCFPARSRSTPPPAGRFPGVELLALLLDRQILFRSAPAKLCFNRPRATTACSLGLSRSSLPRAHTEGRHANPLGGTYPGSGPLLRCRPSAPAGLERQSICGKSRQAARPSRRSKAPARTPLNAQLRRPSTDHARRACAVP